MRAVPDRESVLARLQRIAPDRVDVNADQLVSTATLSDLGLDSFQFIELVFAIEEEFGVKIDLETLNAETVQDMVDVIIEQIAKRP